MNINLPQAITQYEPYVLPWLIAFAVAFLITPLIGKFAKTYGFVDLPAAKRGRLDKTKAQRIHTKVVPRLGGLAIITAFFATLLIFDNVPSQAIGILIGLGLITVTGVLDDKFNLSGKDQLLFQLLAAVIVVISGVTIADIQIAGQFIDLSSFSQQLNFGLFEYTFIFPADFITIAWIMFVMNAFAWTCGIDALGESLAFIASITFGALSMKFGNPYYTLMFFSFAGSLFGFIPYNFPTAKIMGGTVGHLNYGFFLATMAIVSGTKLPTAIIILTIPIIDMIWVLFGRLRRNKINSIFELLSISDRTHLHHRIMDLGFSVKQTLYLELVLFSFFAVIGFYFGGFSFDFVILTSVIVFILFIFAIIGILYKREWTSKQRISAKRAHAPIKKEPTPEERYAY